jgi:hypothetical protein
MSEHDDYDDEPWRPRASPEKLLLIPASILGAFGAIQLAFTILGCVAMAVLVVWSFFESDDVADLDRTEDTVLAIVVCLGASLLPATNFIIFRGAKRMRSCRNYRLAVAAAVLSLVSLPFFYFIPIAAPVAVWTLIVLSRPDVRARFDAVARDKMTKSIP